MNVQKTLTILLLLISAGHSVITHGAAPNYSNSNSNIGFESLKKIIEENHITSIEALLPLLPDDFRSKYALIFASRSLQGSSFADPRVLLFNEGATFMASFNGNPNQKAFYAIETMEYDSHDSEFRYREIEFPTPSDKSNRVKYSEVNPERCLKCHGNPARPIWDTWPLWPGAYGERYHAPLTDQEQHGLETFLAAQPTHSRYRYLLNTGVFANKETFNPSHENKYNGRQKLSPNEQLSRSLSLLNADRIAKQVSRAKDFDHYKYAILASLHGECGSLDDFFPEDLRMTFREKKQDFLKRSELRNTEQESLKTLRLLPQNRTKVSLRESEKESLAAFRLLVEDGLGISTDPWTTALEAGTYDFTAPKSVRTQIENRLTSLVSGSDELLARVAALSQVSSSDNYCLYLRKKSNSALDLMTAQKFAALKAVTPTSLKTCAMCHDGDVGPEFPFNDPRALSKLLGTGHYPRGNLMDEIKFRLSPAAGLEQMPRGRNITEKERADLENFLQGLLR